jgi:hypothetical protein
MQMTLLRSKKSTINMKNKIILFLALLIFSPYLVKSQEIGGKKKLFSNLKTKITIRKTGPYIGIERGKYSLIEFGGEMQWKKVKWIKPTTNAIHTGMNYNFENNVLGYDVGYWIKTGRLNMTYGANLCYRTDFTHDRVGFAPVIGYKLAQFHFQTGYHFLNRVPNFTTTNTFFVSLKLVLVNNRKIDFDK